ncbi:MAG: FHA domain-containing protein [Symploca sp. SIO3E6]|nr:FHA domain-containing protein [Caldora sp. SIO3E6]
MSKAKTSQFHQPPPNLSNIDISKEPGETSEFNVVHWLIVTDNKGERRYPLGGKVYSIGRDSNADICLFSMFVSRRHATLVRQKRKDGSYNYQIVDGDLEGRLSANGIMINGRKLLAPKIENKLAAQNLKHQDMIVFGAGVSATYHRLDRQQRPAESQSGSLDPLDDITLIDPSMIDLED